MKPRSEPEAIEKAAATKRVGDEADRNKAEVIALCLRCRDVTFRTSATAEFATNARDVVEVGGVFEPGQQPVQGSARLGYVEISADPPPLPQKDEKFQLEYTRFHRSILSAHTMLVH